MTRLVRFLDDDRKGRWANLIMDNGDPCWVGIAQSGVLVKKSKIGMFGEILYEERNIHKVAEKAIALDEIYTEDITPFGIMNPVLKAFVNAILRCSDLAGVMRVLNRTESIEVAENGFSKHQETVKQESVEQSVLESDDAAERLFEEHLFEKALMELEVGELRNGLWSKALAHSSGDEGKAKSLYLGYRVQSMYDEKIVTKVKEKNVHTDKYIPIEEFSKNKGVTVGFALKMIQDGFYQGQVIDRKWHVKA